MFIDPRHRAARAAGAAAPAVSLRRGHAHRVPAGVRARAHRVAPTAARRWGGAAELMAPKWFDKNLALTNDDNFDQLRDVLRLARAAYLATRRRTPRSATSRATTTRTRPPARRAAHNPLLASYGPALVDRALLDALCRALGVSFYAAMRDNLVGLGPRHRAVRRLRLARLPAHARAQRGHRGAPHRRPGRCDHRGRPDSIRSTTACPRRSSRWSRATATAISSSRSAAASTHDVARLSAIAAVLDRSARAYFVSLDGNEQYENADGVAELLARMKRDAARSARLLRLDPLHRAADRAQERARRRRARDRRDQAGDHRRVRRRARRVRARARRSATPASRARPARACTSRCSTPRAARRGTPRRARRATSCRART